MPTRRDWMSTSLSLIVGRCTWVTTGLLGSSKIRVFMTRPPGAASADRFDAPAFRRDENRLEERDSVDQLLPGDRIGSRSAHGAGKCHEIVPDRLGFSDLGRLYFLPRYRRCDHPAVWRLDMGLVADIDPALGSINGEARHER